jgi:hypothetical protein
LEGHRAGRRAIVEGERDRVARPVDRQVVFGIADEEKAIRAVLERGNIVVPETVLEPQRVRGIVEGSPVLPSAGSQEVVPASAVENVLALAAVVIIVALLAQQPVGLLPARKVVVPTSAGQCVVAPSAEQDVLASERRDRVIERPKAERPARSSRNSRF